MSGRHANLLRLITPLCRSAELCCYAGVLPQIQEYFHIDFTMAGLIQTAFVISYMCLSPVFGYFGDRYNRNRIMAGGIAFWALATLASSFVGPNVSANASENCISFAFKLADLLRA